MSSFDDMVAAARGEVDAADRREAEERSRKQEAQRRMDADAAPQLKEFGRLVADHLRRAGVPLTDGVWRLPVTNRPTTFRRRKDGQYFRDSDRLLGLEVSGDGVVHLNNARLIETDSVSGTVSSWFYEERSFTFEMLMDASTRKLFVVARDYIPEPLFEYGARAVANLEAGWKDRRED